MPGAFDTRALDLKTSNFGENCILSSTLKSRKFSPEYVFMCPRHKEGMGWETRNIKERSELSLARSLYIWVRTWQIHFHVLPEDRKLSNGNWKNKLYFYPLITVSILCSVKS